MTRPPIATLGLAALLGCQPAERRALVLDLAMSDPALLEGTAAPWRAAGYAVEYRPTYPHLTRADLARYGVVLFLAGVTPERWSDALSVGDLVLLSEWVPRGGVAVFGYAGDGEGTLDRWTVNRWLAAMGAGIAIDHEPLRDTVAAVRGLGGYASARAVPGPLNHSGTFPFPGGRVHALAVRGSEQILARAPASAFARPAGSAPRSRAHAPVVAASRVGHGLVVVTSRHLLGAIGPELRGAAAILVRDSLPATRRFLVALARWTRHPAEWAAVPPAERGQGLDLTGAPRVIALRPPPLAPPAGVATWQLPRDDTPIDSAAVQVPPWIEREGIRVAWSDLPLTGPGAVDALAGFLDGAGLNVLATPPASLPAADTAPAPRRAKNPPPSPEQEALARLGATSIRWFAVVTLGGSDRTCLLDDSLWVDVLAPAIGSLAERARARTGPVAGVTFTLRPAAEGVAPELCPSSIRAGLGRMQRDSAWIERLVALPPTARYDTLLEAGLLNDYLVALEAEVAARALRLARAARQRAPGLWFALRTSDPPADWRSFGLARGLGDDRRSVQLWDAEPVAGAIVEAYRRRGVSPLHVVRVRPEQVPRGAWGRLGAAVFDSSAGFWIGPIEAVSSDPRTAAGPVSADSLERLIRRLSKHPRE